MSDEERQSCGRCKFFMAYPEPKPNGIEGRCVLAQPKHIDGRWPGVRRAEWCGRFLPAVGVVISKTLLRNVRTVLRKLAEAGGASPADLEALAERLTPGDEIGEAS